MLQIGDGLACNRFRIMLLAHQERKQIIIANVLVCHFAQIAQVIVMQFVLEELDYLRLRLAFGNVDIRFGHTRNIPLFKRMPTNTLPYMPG